MGHRRGLWIKGKREEVGFRRERKRFRDRGKGLRVNETDEWVIFVIFIMVSPLTGAQVLR